MTPNDLKEARNKLGLSAAKLGKLIRVDPVTVRRWEMSADKKSHRSIPGPVAVLMEWLAYGKKPKL